MMPWCCVLKEQDFRYKFKHFGKRDCVNQRISFSVDHLGDYCLYMMRSHLAQGIACQLYNLPKSSILGCNVTDGKHSSLAKPPMML
jgi:hypothetical protein